MTPARLHASCAARAGAGVLLLGRPGAGKLDLLLRLISAGYDLVADDRVEIDDGLARAPEALRGLIEVRGWGIVRFEKSVTARPVLAVRLGNAKDIPRLPDEHQTHDPETGLPLLRLDPTSPSAVQRIDLALDCLAGRLHLLTQGPMRQKNGEE